ncbi:hypothetical protein BOX15_Mlig012025g2 [Macrostomum lignano]|uniref:MYND-type domain-containing protein n=1 Tax=Macrostomum lignano TaxID=282301 RepID=A0A267E7W9_9PLAT|nr:hypothetical protein BOX15_Mlig012025g2 [Macrostomum lignano]
MNEAAESEETAIANLSWPDRPDNFYFHFACQLCKTVCQPPASDSNSSSSSSGNSRERRCNSCKLVVYCCQAHRRLDKPAHRSFCQAVRRHRKQIVSGAGLFSDAKGLDAAEFWRLRQRKIASIVDLLGRQLAPWERQALIYPRLCCICYSDRRLSLCPVCLSAAYCCPEHRRQHEAAHRGNAVSHTKLFNAYLLLRELHFNGLPDPPLCVYQPRVDSYSPLEMQPRLDFLNSDDAPSLMPQLTAAPAASEAASTGIAPWVRQAFASESASYPLTLLYVWEQVRPPPGTEPLASRSCLTIQLARWPRSVPITRANWELLLHRLPKLKLLRIILLLLEADKEEENSSDEPESDGIINVCDDCAAFGARIELRRLRLVGGEATAQADAAVDEPDAVCLFNLRRPLALPPAASTPLPPLLLRSSGAPLLATFESARLCRDLPRLLAPLMPLVKASSGGPDGRTRTRWPSGVNPAFSGLPRRLPIEADGDPACCHTNWCLSVLWAD